MTTQNMVNRRGIAGYTIDQTILIVAIIAILITLIIASVGWDLLNRTGGTKAASHMRQMEEAAGAFYARNGMWMDDAIFECSGATPAPETMLTVLQQRSALGGCAAGDRLFEKHTNLLPSFEAASGTVLTLQHSFGPGGDMAVHRVDEAAADLTPSIDQGVYFVFEMNNVPLSEAQEADEAIDGGVQEALGSPTGRLLIHELDAGCAAADTGAAAGDRTVDVCYIGNLLN